MPKKFQVTIIGVNSAFPVHGRHPSCQIVNYDEKLIMIDCGEGAQIQISKYKIKKSRLDYILISHLHGDHCYGLPGILTSFSLGGRTTPLQVYGPIGIAKFINTIMEVSGAHMAFPLIINELDTEVRNEISVTNSLSVSTFPMKHRMPTMGFRLQERITERNIIAEKIKEHQLTIDEIKLAKSGQDVIRESVTLSVGELTYPIATARSYSYCSDTVYDEDLVQYVKGSTTLYHETTYLDDLKEIARERMHSTLGDAINIAKLASVENLITGHYSSRYAEPQIFLKNGLKKFPGLLLGEEGRTYEIG